MWDGFNLRKFPRLAAQCWIQLFPYRSTRRGIKAKTRNIGLGGICVYLDKPLRKFARCRLVLRLNKKYKILQCEGQVAWRVATQTDGRTRKRLYDTGIEFVNCPPDMMQTLEKFLAGQS